MAGGGDFGAGFDPTAGGGGSTSSGFGGFGDPSAFPGATGSDFTTGFDSGNAYTGDQAFGGPSMGGITMDPYSSDPNVGAPQSQAATRGTTPTSIGGTQSDTSGYPGGNQGYGGGALPGQLQQTIQKLVDQLAKQTSTQPTFGRPSPESTFANQQYPQPAQPTFPSGRRDDSIEQPFPSGRRDDSIQQSFPLGRQDAPNPSAPFPTGRRDAPTPYAGPGGGYSGGQTFGDTIEPADQSILPSGTAQQPLSPQATHGAVPWSDFPQEPTGTATDHPAAGDPAATAATTPTAATAPTTPPAAPESPSTTSPGQPAPAGAEMFNPFRALSDILTGNFSDLQHMKGGTPAQAAGPGYGPGTTPPTQDTGTTPPSGTESQVAGPPTAGSQNVNSKPGAPDDRGDQPDDGFKAQRQEWYKTHDRADPFPHDVGQGYQGGPLAGRPDTPTAQPGQQGVPERGSYPQLQTRMAPGRQMGPVNPGLQDTMAAAASQFEANNPGYKVQVNSGARGSNDPHGRHNAVDMQIIGPDGQPIKNSGADRTGKYAELANNALAAQRALHPELNGKFMWGGYFNKDGGHGFADPSTGNNDPDLMHFDIEGNRSHRTAMRDRYYSTFRQGPQGQRAQQPANVGPQDQGSYAQADQYDGRGRGGTRGDRNNNPGNVKTRNAPGQIGIDREGHAIFSNWGDGRRAQAGVLQRVYNGQSINQMSRRYTATVGDQPAWARTVASVSGLDPNQPLNMNDPRILDGIQRGIWQAEGTRIPGGGGRTPPATAVGPTPTRTPTPTPTRGDFPNTSPRAEVNPPNLAQLYGMDWV